MPRADFYPDQAAAQTERLQQDASQADDAVERTRKLLDELERRIDAAFDAGDETVVADLEDRYQQVEQDLEAANQDFESVMEQIAFSHTYWYVEDDED